MENTRKSRKQFLLNLMVPSIVFGSITGVFTAVIVLLYKKAAIHVVEWSEYLYRLFKEQPLWLVLAAAVLFGVSFLFAFIYKRVPNLKGGGIPTSIAILRGIIAFKWLRNLVGVIALSLSSFLVGVPLGNEGPSVQIGTAVGRGAVRVFAKKHRAWDRYSMTGGACAGFSVATGAPISGIMFAVEEAHQRISPMIIIVSTISVIFANFTSTVLAPLFGVDNAIFENHQTMALSLKDVWLPVCIGIVIGLFAVLFLKYYRAVSAFFNQTLKKVGLPYKIFAVFALTVAAGLLADGFVSSGHHLLLSLFDGGFPIYTLLLILLVRATLMLGANTNGVTGGMFIPMLALGALVAAVFGEILTAYCGLDAAYFSVILTFGIIACIAAMMKTPITAVVFAVEVLNCHMNILYVITVCAVSYMITEIFGAKSINDTAVEDKMEQLEEEQTPVLIDTFVVVKKDAFAIGKQVRDIFWPANLFVLSITHAANRKTVVDEHGGKSILEGDTLHVRYSTYNEAETKEELEAIVGAQDAPTAVEQE